MNEIWNIVFEILVCFLQVFWVHDIIKEIFIQRKRKHQKQVTAVFYALLALLLMAAGNLRLYSILVYFACALLIFLYLTFYTRGEVPQNAAVSAFMVVTMVLILLGSTNMIAALNFRKTGIVLFDKNNIQIDTAVLYAMALYVFSGVIKGIFGGNEHGVMKTDAVLMVVVAIVAVAMSVFLFIVASYAVSPVQRTWISVCYLGMWVMQSVFIYMAKNIISKNESLYKVEKEKIKDGYIKQYAVGVAQANETLQKMRHDMKGHLQVVLGFIRNGETEKAVSYLQKNMDKINEGKMYLNTDNEALNIIVNAKFALAEEKGIRVSGDCEKHISGIEDTDMTSLIDNALSNAIAAAEDADEGERYIRLSISREENYIKILVENSLRESVVNNNPRLLTTKPDKKRHGLGTRIMKEIAEKYNGSWSFRENGKVFQCCIIVEEIEEKEGDAC